MSRKKPRWGRADFQERFSAFLSAVRGDIQQGVLKSGDVLEPENDLAERFQLSRTSIRKGLDVLEEEGLIERARGKGTFVKSQGGVERSNLRLGIYTPAYEMSMWTRVLAEYRKVQPESLVDIIRFSDQSYVESLVDLQAVGGAPDLFFVSSGRTEYLQSHLDLVDLSEEMGSEIEKWSFYPRVKEAFESHNHLLVVPVIFSPVVLAFNQDLFDRAALPYPDSTWTWHTLREIARKLTVRSSEGTIEQFGFGISLGPNRWPVLLLQNGVRLGPGGCQLDDPKVIEATKFLHDLMQKNQVSPIEAIGGASYEELFADGRIAMILTSYLAINEYRDLPIRWDVSFPPMGKERATLLVSVGLAVNAHSPRKEQALDLVRFFLSKDTQRLIKKSGTSIPARRDVCDTGDDLMKGLHPPGYHVFQQLMPFAYPPTALGPDVYLSTLRNHLGKVVNNLQPAQQACEKAQQELQRKLKASEGISNPA